MFNKFSFIFLLVIILMGIVIFHGKTEDMNPTGDIYADVHGECVNDLHLHGIVYVSDDPNRNSDASGNYTIVLKAEETKPDDNPWGERWGVGPEKTIQGAFVGGIKKEDDFDCERPVGGDVRDIAWTASATIEIKVSLADPIIYRDFDNKEMNEHNENDEWEDDQDAIDTTPGLFLADSDQTPQPGDSVTLNLVTSEPYYDVSWYVLGPSETGDRGTYQTGSSGDGTTTETSFSYTFPSGAMHTGDYLITAVIYRWSDMSSYEESYTITVDMTP